MIVASLSSSSLASKISAAQIQEAKKNKENQNKKNKGNQNTKIKYEQTHKKDEESNKSPNNIKMLENGKEKRGGGKALDFRRLSS